jgi:hypothetical protein
MCLLRDQAELSAGVIGFQQGPGVAAACLLVSMEAATCCYYSVLVAVL